MRGWSDNIEVNDIRIIDFRCEFEKGTVVLVGNGDGNNYICTGIKSKRQYVISQKNIGSKAPEHILKQLEGWSDLQEKLRIEKELNGIKDKKKKEEAKLAEKLRREAIEAEIEKERLAKENIRMGARFHLA